VSEGRAPVRKGPVIGQEFQIAVAIEVLEVRVSSMSCFDLSDSLEYRPQLEHMEGEAIQIS
jgi:hypothetical protein